MKKLFTHGNQEKFILCSMILPFAGYSASKSTLSTPFVCSTPYSILKTTTKSSA
jgi:hypothetical protein